MQKIKNIEFLRVLLMFGIVILHICSACSWSFYRLFKDIPFYNSLHDCFCHSNNGVEVFFIIAGLFLVLTFKKSTSISDFIKKKYVRLSPVIIFSMLISLIGVGLGVLTFKVLPNIMTILLLNNFGFSFCAGVNPVLWFTSALFFGLLVYFLVLKFCPEKYHKWIFSILSILSYGLVLYLQGGRFFKPCTNYLILNAGVLRALGGVGLGCFIGDFYKNNIALLNNINFSINRKISITILELCLIVYLFGWLFFPHKISNPVLFIIYSSVLIFFFILRKGFISEFFNNDFWVNLGKYQYSIYVVHFVVGKTLNLSLWAKNPEFVYAHPVIPVIISVGISILVGVLAFYLVEKPCAKYLTDKFLSRKLEVKGKV